MAWPIKCLLWKHENLNVDPQDPQNRSGAVACSCDSSIRQAETGRSLGLAAQPVYMNTVRDASYTIVTASDFLQMCGP